VAAHLGSSGAGSAELNAAVAVTPLLAAWTVLLWQWRSPWVLAVGLAGAALLVFALWASLRQNVPLLYYLQHIGSHLALAMWFGKSLLGPGDALITSMARFLDGGKLSERKQRYTRQVTMAWTAFFLLNALVSTVLFLAAPVAVWSIHANLLTGPLVATMFVGEHLVRMRVLPAHERPSLADVVRAYRQRSAERRKHEPRGS
jgi:uncharacterized membrane protein